MREAGIPAISLDVPAVRTSELPLSHDAHIIEILRDARIGVGSVVPIWEDVDYSTQPETQQRPRHVARDDRSMSLAPRRELDVEVGALSLENGFSLPAVTQRVSLYGAEPRPDGKNVVYVPHALNRQQSDRGLVGRICWPGAGA